jgi:hypothetical protein
MIFFKIKNHAASNSAAENIETATVYKE